MRLVNLASGLLLLATTAHAGVSVQNFEAETVGSMHQLCIADENVADGKYALGFCYGWIEGLGQFYEQLLVDERFDLEPAVCADSTLSREDVRLIFVNWAAAHPNAAEEPALEGIIQAMKEKYPC